MIDQTISHYRIVEKLGEGGMGVVYIAEDTHLARRVAIKFLASPDHSYRARFLREARAVSALTHPNIATVFDYGETEQDQPYIVMELVKGHTLGDLLEQSSVTLAEAIRIVSAIAEALGEAHHQGIIHRDIKPSNVVITERGQVKVLDFGLVKNLTERDGDTNPNGPTLLTTHTRSDIVVGTPLYLSPEQATGKSLDGRSDLFALGAVLYECITGQSAFSGASVIEIGAQIIHVDPPPPSKINPHVPAELDRITMKALKKEVEARYQSAAEMVEDLLAVLATLDSNGFRTPRLSARTTAAPTAVPSGAFTTLNETFRRPRLSLASFIIAILVVGFAVWGVVHWWKPSPYKPAPLALDLYNKGSDALRNGAFLQASKLLQQAVAIDDKFALAHARLAEAWSELDYTDRAQNEMLRVSTLVPDRSLLPGIDALYLEAVYSSVSRDFPAAINAYTEIARLMPGEARAYVDVGRAYEKNDQIDRAVENYLQATTLDSQYATAYLRAGVGYRRRQDVASAFSVFDKAESLFKALGNVEGVAEVFHQRGILFRGTGKFADARSQFQQALDTALATGNESQEIQTLIELGFLSYTEGLTAQAQKYAKQAVEFAQQKQLENLATGALIELGNSFRARGDYPEAETYFKQALDFARANKGRRREAAALLDLGGLYIEQFRTDEGLPLVQQAFSFYQQGNYRREISLCLTEIGRANRRKGEYEAALNALQQKFQLSQQGGDQAQIAFTYGEIGSVLIEQERYTEALKQYDDGYAINKSMDNRISMAFNQHNRGNILWRLGRYSEALRALNEAFTIANQPDSSYKQLLPDIQLSRAQINLSQHKFSEAIKNSEQAMEMAGTRYVNVAIEAKYTLGLAKALSGAVRDGEELCGSALKTALAAGDTALISRATLAAAEATLEAGDAKTALGLAEQAQERFGLSGQLESNWRAWLLAARCNDRLGDRMLSQQQMSRAKESLSQLGQKWDPEALTQYLTRPDIQMYYKQLG